jgi:hypothetical protein
MGFVEIGMILEPIESSVQLSSIFLSSLKTDSPSIASSSTEVDLQHCSKQLIRCLSATLQQQNDYSNGSSPSYRSNILPSDNNGSCRQQQQQQQSQNHKRTPRIIGKRGTRDTEFMHPSSLAYSKRDQLICKKYKNLYFCSKLFFYYRCM